MSWKPPEEHDISRSDGIGGREQFPNSPLPLVDPLLDDWQVPSEPFMVSDQFRETFGWFVSTYWSNLNLSSFRFYICILTFYQLIDQLDKLENMWSSYTKKCLLHSPKLLKMDNLPTIFENFFQSNQHGIHGQVKEVEKSLLKLKRFSATLTCYKKLIFLLKTKIIFETLSFISKFSNWISNQYWICL